jgi:hypothetical protein
MVDWTKPIQTKDGRKARVICTDVNNVDYPIVCIIKVDGIEYPFPFTNNGNFHIGINGLNNDIINVPEKRTVEGWLVIKDDSLHDWTFYMKKEYAEKFVEKYGGLIVRMSGEY